MTLALAATKSTAVASSEAFLLHPDKLAGVAFGSRRPVAQAGKHYTGSIDQRDSALRRLFRPRANKRRPPRGILRVRASQRRIAPLNSFSISPMLHASRYGLDSFFLGLASGRIWIWRAHMDLAALTNRPAVPRFPQRVRYNVEGVRMNFDHERIVQQRRWRHQNEIRSPESNWPLRNGGSRKYRPFPGSARTPRGNQSGTTPRYEC